jgi:tetratricopeptide (TPR) repeat protein
MAQILKFPLQASKFGYKRVRQRSKPAENPNQLHLFPQPTAQILSFASGLSCFEHALLLDERDDDKAAELYRKAIEENDCAADAYCNLGIIESKRGNIAKAFDCFTCSLKQNPRHFEAHYNLGNMYFDANDYRLAQLHYELAAEVDAAFPNVHFNLALVQAINNDLGAALTTLTRYQQLVSAAEGRNVEDLLENLRKSLTAAKNPRSDPTPLR